MELLLNVLLVIIAYRVEMEKEATKSQNDYH